MEVVEQAALADTCCNKQKERENQCSNTKPEALTPEQVLAAIERAQKWIGRIEARALRAIALGKRDV